MESFIITVTFLLIGMALKRIPDFSDDTDLGSGHAKWLKSWGKSSKNSRFLVLNIPFWVQNNSSKDFFKNYISLKGPFGGQKESFKKILGPILGLF